MRPELKSVLRIGYRAVQGIRLAAAMPVVGGGSEARVFYGGAFTGDSGGPLVKVARLKEHFPEHCWRFNIVYALSNAPYLPRAAMALLRARRVPIVLNQNGVFYPGWYDGDWRGMNSVMAQGYHLADYVLWQSDFCRRAADRFLGERQGAGEILYNAVDTVRFSPVPRPSGQPFTFLVTGKIASHMAYRLRSTLEGLAWARAQGLQARLTIAGGIDLGARLQTEDHLRSLGLADVVTITGPYTQAAAPDVYRAADAYVMTKYLDPCPNTVLEAMACGLPVLYSASGGVPELVGVDAGIGLPVPEDWERIHVPGAAAVGEGMIRIAAAVGPMAVTARQRAVERFDIVAWVARHRAVFGAVLEGRQ